jgi:hypothetical protein
MAGHGHVKKHEDFRSLATTTAKRMLSKHNMQAESATRPLRRWKAVCLRTLACTVSSYCVVDFTALQ